MRDFMDIFEKDELNEHLMGLLRELDNDVIGLWMLIQDKEVFNLNDDEFRDYIEPFPKPSTNEL